MTWHWLSARDANALVKGADGFYHCDAQDGPTVFAAVGSAGDIPQGLMTVLPEAIRRDPVSVIWTDGKADADNKITSYDLTHFFAQYGAAADKNGGVHPLTEELRAALTQFAKTSGAARALGWTESEGGFAFACGYFRDDSFDAAARAGSARNPIPLSVGDNPVVIPEDGSAEGVWYVFTPAETSVYRLTTSDDCARLQSPDGLINGVEGAGFVSRELVAGKAYVLHLGYREAAAHRSYTLRIAKEMLTIPTGEGTRGDPAALAEDGWYRVRAEACDEGYGAYFVFRAEHSGTWKLRFYCPDAAIFSYGTASTETCYMLGGADAERTVTIEAAAGKTYLFFMGAKAPTSYFFSFEEV